MNPIDPGGGGRTDGLDQDGAVRTPIYDWEASGEVVDIVPGNMSTCIIPTGRRSQGTSQPIKSHR